MSLRLNLGCNDLPLFDFTNIDIDPRVKPDVVADCLQLPYEDNTVDEIYAGHLLEHTAIYENALAEWYRVLKPGGKITITVPDTGKALEQYKKGIISLELLNQVVFGADDRNEQNHHQVFTEYILLEQMNKYFKTKIIEDSPLALIKVDWQTIAVGIK